MPHVIGHLFENTAGQSWCHREINTIFPKPNKPARFTDRDCRWYGCNKR